MGDNPKRKAMTVGFNILLFLYLIYVSFVSVLFSPESDSRVRMDDFFEIAPTTSIVAAVALGVVLILMGALVFRAFWNRLVTSLFSVRDINYPRGIIYHADDRRAVWSLGCEIKEGRKSLSEFRAN